MEKGHTRLTNRWLLVTKPVDLGGLWIANVRACNKALLVASS